MLGAEYTILDNAVLTMRGLKEDTSRGFFNYDGQSKRLAAREA